MKRLEKMPPAAPTRRAPGGGSPWTPDPHGFDCVSTLSKLLKLFIYEICKKNNLSVNLTYYISHAVHIGGPGGAALWRPPRRRRRRHFY